MPPTKIENEQSTLLQDWSGEVFSSCMTNCTLGEHKCDSIVTCLYGKLIIGLYMEII